MSLEMVLALSLALNAAAVGFGLAWLRTRRLVRDINDATTDTKIKTAVLRDRLERGYYEFGEKP